MVYKAPKKANINVSPRRTKLHNPELNSLNNPRKTRREVLESPNDKTKPFRIVNYQDKEIHDAQKRVNEADNYNKAFLLRFAEILNNYGDLSFFLEILRFRNGDVTCDQSNERINNILKVSSDMPDFTFSPFVSKSNGASSWFRLFDETSSSFYLLSDRPHILCNEILNSDDQTEKNKLKKEQGEDKEQNFPSFGDDYVGWSVNKLVEEEEKLGMVMKVYICSKCDAGTSYCAKVIDKTEGNWICNYCEYKNNIQSNQFYLYNKIGASFGSLLFSLKGENTPPKATSSKGAMSSLAEILNYELYDPRIEYSLFYKGVWKERLKCKLFNTPLKVSETETYGQFFIMFVSISCHEVILSEGKTVFLFQVRFVSDNLPNDVIHRLMILPKIKCKEKKMPLDELLAVLMDDINHLSFDGINVTTEEGSRHFKFYLTSLNCDPKIHEIIYGNVAKRGLYNSHIGAKDSLLPFIDTIIDYMVKPLMKVLIDQIREQPNWSAILPSITNSSDNLRKEELGSDQRVVLSPDDVNLWDSFQVFEAFTIVMNDDSQVGDILNKVASSEMHDFFNDIYELLSMVADTNHGVLPIRLIESQLMKAVQTHRKLTKAHKVKDCPYTYILLTLSKSMAYYGKITELCGSRVTPLELSIFSRRLKWKKARNITNTLNKTDVVLFNYMSTFYRFFKTLIEGNKILDSNPTTFAQKIEALLNDLTLSEDFILNILVKQQC